jgi:hypothetical protein
MNFQEKVIELSNKMRTVTLLWGKIPVLTTKYGELEIAIQGGDYKRAKELVEELLPSWVILREYYKLAFRYKKAGGNLQFIFSNYEECLQINGEGAIVIPVVQQKYESIEGLSLFIIKTDRIFLHWEKRVQKHLRFKKA